MLSIPLTLRKKKENTEQKRRLEEKRLLSLGQDLQCELFVIVLAGTHRLWEPSENTSCGRVGKTEAVGGLRLIQGKAALWADGF